MQEIEFQSCSWNSSNGPVRFYINIDLGFTDIPMKDGKPTLTGSARIEQLVTDAPKHFDLTPFNYECIRDEVLTIIPQALLELPKHYEDVRSRAQAGKHTPMPLPETWRG